MARSRRRDDDDDDDDDRPVKKNRSRRDDDDDDDEDEDEDERPSKKKSRSRRDDDDDDDDEDEDERPRKKLKKKARRKAGPPVALFLGIGGGAVVLLLVAGIAAFFLFFNETPTNAFNDFQNAIQAKNYGRMYDRLDTDGQKFLDGMSELSVKMDPNMAAHKDKKGREAFIAMAQEGDRKGTNKMNEQFKRATVETVKADGDFATLTIKTSEGKTETVKMRKQNGTWRIGFGPNAR
jgi:hypothetical protein